MEVKERVFLVGCPRSGTTILQAALASHWRVTSFPESAFFREAVRQFRKRFGYARNSDPGTSSSNIALRGWRHLQEFVLSDLRPGHLAHPGANACVVNFLEQVQRPDLIRLYPRDTWRLDKKIAGFIAILDQLAIERDRDVWIEKTPSHVLYIDVIERHVPGAKFIHLIRSGPDVVASLADAVARNESWRAANPGLVGVTRMVDLWNRCYKQSKSCKDLENHLVLKYEKFLEDPEWALRQASHFMGLGFQPSMLLPDGAGLWAIGAMGPAKRGVSEGIKAPEEKFTTIFTPEEQAYILANLKNKKGRERARTRNSAAESNAS